METNNVGLRDLRAFCRVVDLGSVTAAAASLGETKGAVSRRITRLEATLGVPLVLRSARRVRPTEEGRIYRERVGVAITLVDEAGVALGGQRAEPTGVVRLTAPHDLGVAFLAPLLGVVAARHPLLTLDVLLTDAVLPFAENGLDLALRAGPSSLPDSSLVGHRLGSLALRLLASPRYLEAHGAPAHPDDLSHHRLLGYRRLRGGSLRMVRTDDAAIGADVSFDLKLIGSDGAFLREAAIAGAGIAAIPSLFAGGAVEDGRLVPVLPGWRAELDGHIYLLHPGGAGLAAGVRAVRDALRELAPARLRGEA